MKKKIRTLVSATIAPACLLLGLSSGCTSEIPADDEYADEYVASSEEALCENRNGLNSAMSAIAVAAGNEIRRWLPLQDFVWNSYSNRLELSRYAASRCADRYCQNTVAALAMQDAPDLTVQFPGNIYLNARLLREALKKNWSEQVSCVKAGSCPQEAYDLRYTNWEFGSCDVKYFYDVLVKDKTTRVTDSTKLDGLKDNLVFLGYPENKMLNFYVRRGQVSIDPTGGLNEGGVTTSGSCTIGCTKYSKTNISGMCCSCNGALKKYTRSSFSAYYYLCK